MKKPTIGRIVHYTAPSDCGGETYAAIVTRVKEVGPDLALTCDLATFGPTSLYFNPDTPGASEATPGHWHWPPTE